MVGEDKIEVVLHEIGDALKTLNQSFADNILSKEAKNELQGEIDILKAKIKKHDEFFLGDGYMNKGLINKIDAISNDLADISDYIKSQKITVRNLSWLFGTIGVSNVICFVTWILKLI